MMAHRARPLFHDMVRSVTLTPRHSRGLSAAGTNPAV